MKPYLIGIDLGGSSAKAVAVTMEGSILEKANESFDPESPLAFVRTVRETVETLEKHQGAPATAIGLSAPGIAAPDGRSISFMPGRLQGLEGRDWAVELTRRDPVPVLNDAQSALLGEIWLGAARGSRNVFLLTLGTGVGGAAVVDGNLLRGAIGRAGHLGHLSLDPDGPPDVCGMPGSLEWAVGNASIRERTGGRFETTHALIAASNAGDSQAKVWWMTSVRRLAAAIASLINVLDPDTVILGGGIARAGEALFHPLERYVRVMEWRPGGSEARIVAAEMGEFAGALGAAYHAMPRKG